MRQTAVFACKIGDDGRHLIQSQGLQERPRIGRAASLPHQRQRHSRAAHRHDGVGMYAVGRTFERCDIHQAEHPGLGCGVPGQPWLPEDAGCGGHKHQSSVSGVAHHGEARADDMKGGQQVMAQQRFEAFRRPVRKRVVVDDAGVGDDRVQSAELRNGEVHCGAPTQFCAGI